MMRASSRRPKVFAAILIASLLILPAAPIGVTSRPSPESTLPAQKRLLSGVAPQPLVSSGSGCYSLLGNVSSPSPQANENFGYSAAVTNGIVAVGSYYVAENVYTYNASTRALVSTLTSPYAQPSGRFGYSVAASDGILAVGAFAESVDGIGGAGRAYLYNATTGALVRNFTSPSPQSNGWFGADVAIEGGFLVVGAPYERAGGYSQAGHAYVFNASSGALVSTLTSPNAQAGGGFGSVAVGGGFAVVAAVLETVGGQSRAGDAYVFNARSGSLVSTLSNPNPQYNDNFGLYIAYDNGTVVLGADEESVNGTASGRVYLFNSTTGALLRTLDSSNAESGGLFGYSIAAYHGTVAVGAPGERAVYLFDERSGNLLDKFALGGGFFGSSLALGGELLVMGDDGQTINDRAVAGEVFIYQSCQTVSEFPAIGTLPNIVVVLVLSLLVALVATRVWGHGGGPKLRHIAVNLTVEPFSLRRLEP